MSCSLFYLFNYYSTLVLFLLLHISYIFLVFEKSETIAKVAARWRYKSSDLLCQWKVPIKQELFAKSKVFTQFFCLRDNFVFLYVSLHSSFPSHIERVRRVTIAYKRPGVLNFNILGLTVKTCRIKRLLSIKRSVRTYSCDSPVFSCNTYIKEV